MNASVTPEYVAEQRELGWPDIHPEDYCHRCGARNTLWYSSREDWLIATVLWATETGREGILCVTCFAGMHEAATGRKTIWQVSGVAA